MSDLNPSSGASDGLAISASGDFKYDDYTIDPADQGLADEIVANFDAARVPGPVKLYGDPIKIDRVRATALPPHLRDPIQAAMSAAAPDRRDAIEQQMVTEALQGVAIDVRKRSGLGSDATPYERERFAVAHDIDKLEAEELAIRSELAAVDHWKPEFDDRGHPVIDPATGQQRVKAYDKVQGDARAAKEGRLREIENALKSIELIEGPRRVAKALKDTIAANKRITEAFAENAEAEKMAQDILRDERIKQRAEGLAKSRRSALG